MKELHEAGAHAIAQGRATCVVFGMLEEAIERKAVDEISPLFAIARDRPLRAVLNPSRVGGRALLVG